MTVVQPPDHLWQRIQSVTLRERGVSPCVCWGPMGGGGCYPASHSRAWRGLLGVWWGRGSTVWRSCTGNCWSGQPTSTWSPALRDPRPSDARAPLRLGGGEDAAVTMQQLRGGAGVKGTRQSFSLSESLSKSLSELRGPRPPASRLQ